MADRCAARTAAIGAEWPASSEAAAARGPGGTKMDSKTELRKTLSADIDSYRKRAEFYRSQRLFEAAHYADKLAENLELALTTLPSGDDPEIA
jgi:hypothetical protein